jgi:hypothetical protein
VKRNLLFHMYPKKGLVWPWHVEQLLRYQDAWNGRRIVILALDHWTISEQEARAALAPLNAEILVCQNNAELGETGHFIEALGMLQSKDPEEATFYAHSKGVSRETPEWRTIVKWCEAMYVLNLEQIGVIERLLARAAAVGAFRAQITHSGAPWCYAGTYFWLKHSTLFSRNWQDVAQGRWGVEGYPGRHIQYEESAVLHFDIVQHRWLPGWLYGRDGSGVTDGHIKMWREELWRMV